MASERPGAMDAQVVREAAGLFVRARRGGGPIDALPSACKPRTVDDAHAIQEATIAALGEAVAGWKVALPLDGRTVRGAILASRVFASGGEVSARMTPLLGIEAEIAFRFDGDLPARAAPYLREEVAQAVTAFVGIEIVDSRFRDYRGTPLLDRIADCMSNGAFVSGDVQPRWRELDLVNVPVRLEIDGVPVVERIGGHPAGDPLLPAIDLVNDLRDRGGVRAGQFMTTGSYTGLHFAKAGQRATARFDGFGRAQIRLAP
jgi:2-keto-4-pentenoate hydratase